MVTSQEKFLDIMRKLARDRGLDIVVEKAFGNVGEMYFQRPDSFKPIIIIDYNFQGTAASIAVFVPENKTPIYKNSHVEYSSGDLDDAIAAITRSLPAVEKHVRTRQEEDEAYAKQKLGEKYPALSAKALDKMTEQFMGFYDDHSLRILKEEIELFVGAGLAQAFIQEQTTNGELRS